MVAMPGAQGRRLPVTLANGQQMTVIISNPAGPCTPLGHPEGDIDEC